MAKVIVEIPDGEFCSDKGHLDCLYAQHNRDEHYCHLYRHFLGGLEDVIINNEKIRVRRKCKPCLNALNGDVGPLSIIVDSEDKTNDKNE